MHLKPSETKDSAKCSSDIRNLLIFSSAKIKDEEKGKELRQSFYLVVIYYQDLTCILRAYALLLKENLFFS